jgi:hypothetical protein
VSLGRLPFRARGWWLEDSRSESPPLRSPEVRKVDLVHLPASPTELEFAIGFQGSHLRSHAFPKASSKTRPTHRNLIVTAAQLAHLAELAAFAADYFARSDPKGAQMFGDTALRADMLSTHLRREESDALHETVRSLPDRP